MGESKLLNVLVDYLDSFYDINDNVKYYSLCLLVGFLRGSQGSRPLKQGPLDSTY